MRLSRCLASLGFGLVVVAVGCAEGSSNTGSSAGGGDSVGGAGGMGGAAGGAGGASLAGLGTSCSEASGCESGLCVDGVCCDSPCDGLCVTCNGGDDAGSCVPFEIDSDPDDECGQASCDGDGACRYAAHRWSTRYGDLVEDEIRDLAIDSAGNIVIVGEFNGNIDFDGQPLVTEGDDDVFVAKLDPTGSVLWAKSFGDSTGAAGQSARAVRIDSQDRIIIAGNFSSDIDFDGTVHVADSSVDIFVAALDGTGAVQWSRAYGPTGAVLTARRVHALAVDASDNILVTGEFKGDIDFDGNVIDDGSGGSESTFLLKLNSAGVHQWSASHGAATGSDQGLALATAPNGDVLLCGFFRDTMTFGANVISAAGGEDIYLARLDANGNALWSRRYGDTAHQRCRALLIDGGDHVWMAGGFAGTINFGGGDVSATDGLDAYLAEFDASGAYLSATAWAGTDDQSVVALGVDSLGNMLAVGELSGVLSLADGDLTSANAQDVFLIKRDANGVLMWGKSYGAIDAQVPVALALAADDDVVLAVRFDDLIDFGGGELASAGATDVAVARLGP